MHDILVEDIRVEYESFHKMSQIQATEESVYTFYDQIMDSRLLDLNDDRYRKYWGKIGALHPLPDIDLSGIEYGSVHDILVRNIKVYYDERIPLKDGKYNVPIEVYKVVPEIKFYNITLENITINGQRLTEENALLINTYQADNLKVI